MIIMVFESTKIRSFPVALTSNSSSLRLAPSICQVLAARHLDGVRQMLWKDIIPRNFFTILINETKAKATQVPKEG